MISLETSALATKTTGHLAIEQLSYHYFLEREQTEFLAFTDVSMSVADGEFVAIDMHAPRIARLQTVALGFGQSAVWGREDRTVDAISRPRRLPAPAATRVIEG